MADTSGTTLSFSSLISGYAKIQKRLVSQIKKLASKNSTANPGQFLMIQFQMSQVTQVGDSISNLIAQVNSMINATVRNQRPQ